MSEKLESFAKENEVLIRNLKSQALWEYSTKYFNDIPTSYRPFNSL